MGKPPTQTPDKSTHTTAESLVLVATGEGKGKSTAAFGTALRSLAQGWNVAVVQFFKSDGWHVGEEKMCRQLGVDWFAAGDGFTWDSDDLEESKAKAIAAWQCASNLIKAGEHRLIILDEVSYAMTWQWIDPADVAAALKKRPSNVSIFLTGRDMAGEVIEAADTVTEMKNSKHAFDAGIIAKKGIDF